MCRVREPAHILPCGALRKTTHSHHTAEEPLLARKQTALPANFSMKTIPWERNSGVWGSCFSFETWSREGNKLHGETPISGTLEKILALASVSLQAFVLCIQFLHLSASQT